MRKIINIFKKNIEKYGITIWYSSVIFPAIILSLNNLFSGKVTETDVVRLGTAAWAFIAWNQDVNSRNLQKQINFFMEDSVKQRMRAEELAATNKALITLLKRIDKQVLKQHGITISDSTVRLRH